MRKYSVQKLVEGTFVDADLAHGKKDAAIALARKLRGEERVGVQVLSPSGAEVVFTMAEPTTDRVIVNKTSMFTRTVTVPAEALGEGVELPAGHTPAYFRPRTGLALLRCDDRNADYTYLLFNVADGTSREFPNCTTAEAVMKAEYDKIKSASAEARAAEKAAKAEARAAAKAERDAKAEKAKAEKAEAKAKKEAEEAERAAAEAAAAEAVAAGGAAEEGDVEEPTPAEVEELVSA